MDRKMDEIVLEVRAQMLEDLTTELMRITSENYISIIAENGNVHYSGNQACTAGLHGIVMREWNQDGNTPAFIVSSLMHGSDGKAPLQNLEAGKAFIDWLVNRSPYAPAFATKDVNEILERGSFVCDAKVSSSLIVGGLIASRVMWEYTNVCKAWYELVSRGCNENLSFLLAHFADYGEGLISFRRYDEGHKSVNYYHVSTEYVNSFINSKPSRLEPPYSELCGYKEISNTWGPYTQRDRSDCVLKELCGKIVYKCDLKNNIFAAAAIKSNPNSCIVEHGFDQLAVLAKKFIKGA